MEFCSADRVMHTISYLRSPSVNSRLVILGSAVLTAIAIGAALQGVPGAILGFGLMVVALSVSYARWSRWAVAPEKKINLATARKQLQKLHHSRRSVRWRAANLLRVAGSDCAPIVPQLVECLSHSDWLIRSHVCGALCAIGTGAKDAVPALIDLMKDDPLSAAMALGGIGPEANAALGPLTDELKSGRYNGKTIFASALWKIGQRAELVVPVLLEVLKEESAGIRRDAVRVLAQVGPPAKAAVPALLLAMRDKDRWVRRLSADALRRIDPSIAAGTVQF